MNRLRHLQQAIRLRLQHPTRRGRVFLEQGARIGRDCRLYVTSLGSEPYLVSIGDETLIAPGVRFITHDGATWAFRDVHPAANRYGTITVGSRCFVGIDTILLPGTIIGDRSIIGAGSVVTGSIPDSVVAVGVPARVVCSTDTYMEKVLAQSLPLTSGASTRDKRRQLERLLLETPRAVADVTHSKAPQA